MNLALKIDRRVSRRATTAQSDAPPVRSSEQVSQAIADLAAARTSAAVRIDELALRWNDVLLSDDDARAEAHQAEVARHQRTVERCDLKRPGLEVELADALTREREECEAIARAEAEVAIAALLERLDAEYRGPAATIAAFMRDWQTVEEQARLAGVETPNDRLRFRKGRHYPASEQIETVYVDQFGEETSSRFPPGTYTVGPNGEEFDRKTGCRFSRSVPPGIGLVMRDGLALVPPNRTKAKLVPVPARDDPDRWLPTFASSVKLPGVAYEDDMIWPVS